MPRKARLDGAGALHHIMVRGIEGRSLFKGDADRERFLEKLGSVLKETGTPCYAWVLMRNHVHLLLRTGSAPLAWVMRRVLTSYALYFNRRYRRHGHLFQNRYKSVLCEEDAYLKELVRYIHLNPIRAKVVESVNDLKEYRFCGHAVLMGKLNCDWQDGDHVLRHFGGKLKEARRCYEAFVVKGVGQSRRQDLVGGGLLRSIGGWSELKRLRRSDERIKGDERILGNSEFVREVLEKAGEDLALRTKAKARGIDLSVLIKMVTRHFLVDSKLLFTPTKNRKISRARAVLCYLAVRKLHMSGAEVARALGVDPSTISYAVGRGGKDAHAAGLEKQLLRDIHH